MTGSGPGGGGSGGLLGAALAAAGCGWPVHPLRPLSKVPRLRDWERRASTDAGQLARWWASQPASNVGIACGPAGLLVLDLDAPGGQPPPSRWAERGVGCGAQVLAVLAEQAGQPFPGGTYTVATPGGVHLYFAAPAGPRLPNTAGRLGWRIDTRSAGGYVVAAGSVLRVAGRLVAYRVVRPGPVLPVPGWIAAALSRSEGGRAAGAVVGSGCGGRYVRAAVAGEARAVAAARSGTRNHRLFGAAASLGELIGAGLLDQHTATEALLAAAGVHVGVDGFTLAEARRAIGNGIARGRRNPRPINPR
jgi:hypothetical protein